MMRLGTSLGILIAMLAIAPKAEAGSYAFSVGGHRFHVEAPRNCRSTSCVSISSRRGIRPADDVDTTPVAPAPTPIAQAPQPLAPAAPVRPAQATVVAPQPAPSAAAPALAAATLQPVAPPPAPRFEAPTLEPQRMAPPVAAPGPEITQTAAIAPRSEDEAGFTPLGEWESAGATGRVRIERCGPALCGYALTEASSRGESVLVNMKPKSHDAWSGSIYSRSSGNTYYATMTLKRTGTLRVEACAIGRFWCSGNDWTRVDGRQETVITTSRQWGARS